MTYPDFASLQKPITDLLSFIMVVVIYIEILARTVSQSYGVLKELKKNWTRGDGGSNGPGNPPRDIPPS